MDRYLSSRFATAISAAAMLFAATPAHAKMTVASVPQALAAAALGRANICHYSASPAQHVASWAKADKTAALLGGRQSALELMKLQQAAGSRQAEPQLAVAPQTPLTGSFDCNVGISAEKQTPATFIAAIRPASALGPADFLASKRLSVSRTTFDREWNRVERAGLSRRTAAKLVSVGTGAATLSTLSAVNAWVNGHIRYVEDSVLYGRSDYWATASGTLRKGAGDCEDMAIAKMQMLAALGVPRSAMYLTVARDLARNADHAFLVVQFDGRHWVLDNATNTLLDGAQSHDYRPIMSFGAHGKWLHGYTQG